MAFFMGAADFIAAALLYFGFEGIPAPEMFKIIIIFALIIKGIISVIPSS